MTFPRYYSKFSLRLVAVLVISFVTVTLSNGKQTKNSRSQKGKLLIAITQIPPQGAGPDVMATISGTVRGVDVKKYRVVIFARTNTWYVQPYTASPYTAIRANGRWATRIHPGDEYAALLVEPGYQPPSTTDELPEIGGPVVAITTAAARSESKPGLVQSTKSQSISTENASGDSLPRKRSIGSVELSSRMIQFSGYSWKVKSSRSEVGPGPNNFSDSHANVEVDAQGRLHLRITKRQGRWYCAEVISTRSFGYGLYKFHVGTNVDGLDPQIVLGMFTWSDDPASSHREIDVEISKWGDIHNQNAQFVVQPYTNPANIFRFEIPRGLSRTTHVCNWRPDLILCQSLKAADDADGIIQKHKFVVGVPSAGGENARINLWLVNGNKPFYGKPAEIVIERFEFVPAGN
jgi:hypothetical protein